MPFYSKVASSFHVPPACSTLEDTYSSFACHHSCVGLHAYIPVRCFIKYFFYYINLYKWEGLVDQNSSFCKIHTRYLELWEFNSSLNYQFFVNCEGCIATTGKPFAFSTTMLVLLRTLVSLTKLEVIFPNFLMEKK